MKSESANAQTPPSEEPTNGGKVVLPPRRQASDPADSARQGVGIRISSNALRTIDEDEPIGLEVQEIGGRVERLAESIPAPQKVERKIVFREREKNQKPQGDAEQDADSWGDKTKKSPRWLIYMAAGTLLLAMLIVVGLPVLRKSMRPQAKKKVGQIVTRVEAVHDTQPSLPEADGVNFLFANELVIDQLLYNYFKATRVEEVIPLIGDAKNVESIVRERWKPLPYKKETSTNLIDLDVFSIDNTYYGSKKIQMPDGSLFVAYFFRENDQVLMDWKASVSYCSTPFEDLTKGKGEGKEIRGVIYYNNFYSAAWPEQEYQSYRLVSNHLDFVIWCYAPRNTKIAADIGEAFTQAKTKHGREHLPVTLRLKRGSKEAAPNQWEIAELIYAHWTKPHSKP